MAQSTTIFTNSTKSETRKPRSTYHALSEQYLLEGELRSLGLHQDNFTNFSLNSLKDRMVEILIEHRRFTKQLVQEFKEKEIENTTNPYIPLDRMEEVSLRLGIEYSALANELVRRVEQGTDNLNWDDFREIMTEIESRAHPETG